jgi:ABC-type uncharacterized transport system involved in gliding motility auxiliary subunit
MKIRSKTVRGQPLEVEGRRLIPVARRTTALWRKALIGNRVAAHGGGFVHLRPLGLVEQHGDEERFIPIRDQTRQALLGLLAAAIIVPLLLIVAVRMARR